jgi:hypothetical protein
VVMLQADVANLFRFDNTEFEDGANIAANIERTYYDFGIPEQVKTLTRIWPRVSSYNANLVLEVRAGGSATPDLPVEWADWVDYVPATTDFVSTFATGRFLSFQFRVTGDTSHLFSLLGFDVELAPRGRF